MQRQQDGNNSKSAVRPAIQSAAPRQNVLAYLSDGQTLEGPVGTSLEAFVAHISQPEEPPVVAALVDGRLCELTCPLVKDANVRFLSNATSDGKRIYQRSLTLLMLAAVRELYPEARITVDHSVSMEGLLCQVRGRPPFTEQEIERIEALMHLIVEQDEPIVKRQMPLDDAIALFEERGYEDKARLLRFRKRDYVVTYSLRQEQDYFYGYMVPSAGYILYFDLVPHPLGFILRAPRRGQPLELPESRESPTLDLVFRRYGDWLNKLDICLSRC